MPHLEILWIEGPDGNIEHLAQNGVTPEEAEDVLHSPSFETSSRTSGRPLAIGLTRAGRRLVVVYEMIDKVTIYPITAYDCD